jgi:hypothetical protein
MDAMETDCLISGAETETVAAFSGSWSFWLAAETMMAVAAETMTTTAAWFCWSFCAAADAETAASKRVWKRLFVSCESHFVGNFIRMRVKYTAKWGLQIAEMIFQTRSILVHRSVNNCIIPCACGVCSLPQAYIYIIVWCELSQRMTRDSYCREFGEKRSEILVCNVLKGRYVQWLRTCLLTI